MTQQEGRAPQENTAQQDRFGLHGDPESQRARKVTSAPPNINLWLLPLAARSFAVTLKLCAGPGTPIDSSHPAAPLGTAGFSVLMLEALALAYGWFTFLKQGDIQQRQRTISLSFVLSLLLELCVRPVSDSIQGRPLDRFSVTTLGICMLIWAAWTVYDLRRNQPKKETSA